MLLVNILFLSTLIDNNNFNHNKLFLNNLDSSSLHLMSNDLQINNIGIVDFRKILRTSNSMKMLGNKFINAEKKLNLKTKLKQVKLKKKEKILLNQKNKISVENYNYNIKLFKEEVFKIQNINKQERFILNKSFQENQKKLKDLLAKIIKEISIKKNINIILLKENIFLLNDQSIDFTNEALNSFNKKTRNLKIKIITSD